MIAVVEFEQGIAWPPDVIDELRSAPAQVATAVRGVSSAALDERPGEDAWSVRTILAHLRDMEFLLMRLRAERILAEDAPKFAPFDEKVWAETRSKDRDSLANLVKDFRLQRQASVAILEALAEADWMSKAYLGDGNGFDLICWIDRWAAHDREHIDDLNRLLGH